MIKHTPTPWTLSERGTLIAIKGPPTKPKHRIGGFTSTVAVVSKLAGFCTQARANAAYTIRAVNSHQALLEAVKCADGIQREMDRNGNRSHGDECIYCYAIVRAEETIHETR